MQYVVSPNFLVPHCYQHHSDTTDFQSSYTLSDLMDSV